MMLLYVPYVLFARSASALLSATSFAINELRRSWYTLQTIGSIRASYPTVLCPVFRRNKIGVVDSLNSSEMNDLSISACKKKGSPSTLDKPPVPAFGVLDLPIA